MGELFERSGNVFALLLRAAESPERGTPKGNTIHWALWCQWLALPLQEQTQCIDEALRHAPALVPFAIADLYEKVTGPQFVPSLATPEERALFAMNFEASMWLIREREKDCTAPAGQLRTRVA